MSICGLVLSAHDDLVTKLEEVMSGMEEVQSIMKGGEFADLKIDKLNAAGEMINEADGLMKNFNFYHKLATGGNAKSETQAYSEKSG